MKGMKNTPTKRSPGRPPVDNPMEQIAIRLDRSQLERIDQVIAERKGQTTRNAVIRELLETALDSREKPA